LILSCQELHMWCAKCQADVAAIASADNQRALCATCSSELLVAPPPTSNSPVVRDPRELLAKWAQEDALDPLQRMPAAATNLPLTGARTPPRPGKPAGKPPQRRYDGDHPTHQSKKPAATPATVETKTTPAVMPTPVAAMEADGPRPPQDVVIHNQHLVAGNPHFQAAALQAQQKKPDRSGRWVTFAGQLAAYLGVGTLTVGAAMVLMAYFGGPQNYAPTGWLVTTAGQMLLFLGVVTLVSGGMEQTTQEVAERIDSLGATIIRLEEYRAQKANEEKKTDAA
jgi:hypothetical protein